MTHHINLDLATLVLWAAATSLGIGISLFQILSSGPDSSPEPPEQTNTSEPTKDKQHD